MLKLGAIVVSRQIIYAVTLVFLKKPFQQDTFSGTLVFIFARS